jgi:hypothetical protein
MSNFHLQQFIIASTSSTAIDDVPSDLTEDKIVSKSSSSTVEDQEKPQDVPPVEKFQAYDGKGDNLLARLQVVGAFFLMFNSWYVSFFQLDIEH